MSELPVRRLIGVLVILAGAIAGTALLLLARGGAGPEIDAEDVLPPGRWHRTGILTPKFDDDAQARAQVLSLPYASGSRAAGHEAGGIRILDPAAVDPHPRIYNSGHAAEAFLIQVDGTLIKRWAMPWNRAFPGVKVPQQPYDWRRVALRPNGDLLGLYQGAGIVRIDSSSRLVWARFGPYFNDLLVAADEHVWTLGKYPTSGERVGRATEVLEDFLIHLDSSGSELERWSLLGALQAQCPQVLDPLVDHPDILHSNTVTRVPRDTSTLRQGDLLISLREIDTIIAFDPTTSTIRWCQRGPWMRQHEPTLDPDDLLLVFDNKGGEPHQSRVVRFDPVERSIRNQLGGFFSAEAGSVQRLPNGNLLVTESEGGRALEFDTEGRLVWEFVSPHRVVVKVPLLATLYEMRTTSWPEAEGSENTPQ